VGLTMAYRLDAHWVSAGPTNGMRIMNGPNNLIREIPGGRLRSNRQEPYTPNRELITKYPCISPLSILRFGRSFELPYHGFVEPAAVEPYVTGGRPLNGAQYRWRLGSPWSIHRFMDRRSTHRYRDHMGQAQRKEHPMGRFNLRVSIYMRGQEAYPRVWSWLRGGNCLPGRRHNADSPNRTNGYQHWSPRASLPGAGVFQSLWRYDRVCPIEGSGHRPSSQSTILPQSLINIRRHAASTHTTVPTYAAMRNGECAKKRSIQKEQCPEGGGFECLRPDAPVKPL
jgi:hypothetical protein